MFTRWIVTTSSGLEAQVARAATYFDNVVAIMENEDVVISNTSGLLNNVRFRFQSHKDNCFLDNYVF